MSKPTSIVGKRGSWHNLVLTDAIASLHDQKGGVKNTEYQGLIVGVSK